MEIMEGRWKQEVFPSKAFFSEFVKSEIAKISSEHEIVCAIPLIFT